MVEDSENHFSSTNTAFSTVPLSTVYSWAARGKSASLRHTLRTRLKYRNLHKLIFRENHLTAFFTFALTLIATKVLNERSITCGTRNSIKCFSSCCSDSVYCGFLVVIASISLKRNISLTDIMTTLLIISETKIIANNVSDLEDCI